MEVSIVEISWNAKSRRYFHFKLQQGDKETRVRSSLTNDLSMTETKPTNGLVTDRLNNTLTKNRPIWLTIDGSKSTNDWWQTLHESFSQYHHGYTDQLRSTDQTYNIIDWQTLFTWLWGWLPLRLSKRQSPTTVLFRTTLTRTIILYEI